MKEDRKEIRREKWERKNLNTHTNRLQEGKEISKQIKNM